MAKAGSKKRTKKSKSLFEEKLPVLRKRWAALESPEPETPVKKRLTDDFFGNMPEKIALIARGLIYSGRMFQAADVIRKFEALHDEIQTITWWNELHVDPADFDPET